MKANKLLFYPLLLILLQFPCLIFSAEKAKDLIQVFYKNPQYPTFVDITEFLAKQTHPHIKDIAEVYTICALFKHKDYADKLVSDFKKFPAAQQELLYQGLLGANFKEEAEKLKKEYHLNFSDTSKFTIEQINALTFPDKIKTREELQKVSGSFDYLWSAFFTTGDEKYIQKLMEYAAKNKDKLTMEKKKSYSEEESNQLIALQAVLWSSLSLSCQDPTIKVIVLKYSKEDKFAMLYKAVASDESCKSNPNPTH